MGQLSLTTALTGAVFGSAALTAALGYLCLLPEPDRSARWWTAAFLSHTLYFAFQLFGFAPDVATFLSQTAQAVTAILLLAGSIAFLQRRVWRLAVGGAIAAAAAWIFWTSMVRPNFLMLAVPAYFMSGTAAIITGLIFLRQRENHPWGAYGITGVIFILFGLHKLDYPLLRPVTWFAPYGFALTEVFTIMLAISLVIVSMDRQRQRAQAAERRIAESEQRHRQAIEASCDWIWETGPDQRFVYVSDGYTKATGWPATHLIGRSRLDMVQESVEPEHWQRHKAEFEARQPFRDLRFTTVHADGKKRHYRTSGMPVYDEKGVFQGYRGTVTNITAEIETDRWLAENEARLRQLTDLASDWVWETRADLRFTYVSEGYVKATGRPLSMLLGVSRADMTDLTTDANSRNMHEEALRTHQSFRDFRYSRPDAQGRMRHYRSSGMPVFDAGGVFQGFRGVTSDISTEIEAERRAVEAQNRLIAAIERLEHGFAFFDADDRLILSNAKYRNVYSGIVEQIVPGAKFGDLVRAAAEANLYAVLPAEREAAIQERLDRHRNPRGSFDQSLTDGRIVAITEQRIADGGTVALWSEVTESRLRERALAHLIGASTSPNSMLRNVAVAISTVLGYRFAGVVERTKGTDHGRMVTVYDRENPTVELAPIDYELTGTPCGTIPRNGNLCFYPSGLADRFPEMGMLRQIGAQSYLGMAFEDPSGEIVGHVFAINDKPDTSAGRTSDFLVLITHWVATEFERRSAETALRSAEANLRAALNQAELASRTKSEFLANMSHELRTPLNAIIGFSDIMKNELFGPIGNVNYADYARDIQDSGTHLLSVINDILDVSKAEAGKIDLHEEEVDVDGIVQASIRYVRDRAQALNVRLVNAIPAGLPQVRADPLRLKQILLNLLSNAVKFTREGGEVTIKGAVTPDGAFDLSIVDTGIGIAPEDIAHVLEPFGQVESTLHRRYEGTGLGLPLAKALVELHGGSLAIESTVGVGTTVTVRLPKQRVLKQLAPTS